MISIVALIVSIVALMVAAANFIYSWASNIELKKELADMDSELEDFLLMEEEAVDMFRTKDSNKNVHLN